MCAEQLFRAAIRLAARKQNARLPRVMPQHQILRDRKIRTKRKLLMHHPNPLPKRIRRRMNPHRLPLNQNRP